MKGKGQSYAPTAPQKIEFSGRDLDLVGMRVRGMSQQAIATEMNISQPRVAAILARWMTARIAEIKEGVDELRQMESDRLDQLQESRWQKALDGDDKAFELVLKVIRQRAALFGINLEPKPDKTVDNGVVFNIVLGGQAQVGQTEPITITASQPATPTISASHSPADPW